MKKIVLINPPLCEDVMKAKYKALAPPLGLLSIAAVLLENKFEVEFIDGDKEESINEIVNKTKIFKPDYVGITATTMCFPNAVKVAKLIRSELKDVFIFMGGQHATYYADKILKKYDFIDAISQGEGEYTVLELMQGSALNSIKGLVYRDKNEIIFNERRGMIENLDELPLPARELAEKYNYNVKFGLFDLRRHCYSKMSNYVSLITSRGCAGGCYFCSGTQYSGKRIRFRSSENVIKEMDMLIQKGYRTFFIPDDNFTASPKRVKEICAYLKEKRKTKDISWFCFGRVDTVTEELFKEMKDAGCFFILFGIEHISKKVRNFYNKNTTNEQIDNAIRIANKYKIGVYASVVVGAPIEDQQDFEECMKYFKKSKAEILEVHRLMVFPGSNLWHSVNERFPEKVEELWEQPIAYTDVDSNTSSDVAIGRQKELTKAFFFRWGFIQRIISRIIATKAEGLSKLIAEKD